jgi:hypothetical protein
MTSAVTDLSAEQDARHYRQFLGAFCGLVAAFLVISTLAAFLLDPVGAFGTGVVPPLIRQDRDEKASLFERLAPAPELVILGSSRELRINPTCVEAMSGLSAFNFALNAAHAEEFAAIYRFIVAQPGHRLRRMLIGVGADIFRNDVPVEPGLRSSRLLGPFAQLPLPTASEIGTRVLGRGALVDDLWAVELLFGPRPPDAAELDPKGATVSLQREPSEAELNAQVKSGVDYALASYVSFTALSEERKAIFESMLGAARAANVGVDVFVSPIHPDFAAGIASSQLAARMAETQNYLADLSRRGLVALHDVSLEAIGASPGEFRDSVHLRESGSNKVARSVLGSKLKCDSVATQRFSEIPR